MQSQGLQHTSREGTSPPRSAARASERVEAFSAASSSASDSARALTTHCARADSEDTCTNSAHVSESESEPARTIVRNRRDEMSVSESEHRGTPPGQRSTCRPTEFVFDTEREVYGDSDYGCNGIATRPSRGNHSALAPNNNENINVRTDHGNNRGDDEARDESMSGQTDRQSMSGQTDRLRRQSSKNVHTPIFQAREEVLLCADLTGTKASLAHDILQGDHAQCIAACDTLIQELDGGCGWESWYVQVLSTLCCRLRRESEAEDGGDACLHVVSAIREVCFLLWFVVIIVMMESLLL